MSMKSQLRFGFQNASSLFRVTSTEGTSGQNAHNNILFDLTFIRKFSPRFSQTKRTVATSSINMQVSWTKTETNILV